MSLGKPESGKRNKEKVEMTYYFTVQTGGNEVSRNEIDAVIC